MWQNMRRNRISSYCVWNVTSHAQKPNFVLLRLKCDVTCAEIRFRLTAFEMWCHMRRNQISSYCVWNVMSHAQKPDFVFRRNGRVHLNRQGASVQSTTATRGVRISCGNVGYTPCSDVVRKVLATHSIRKFPLHFPYRASPRAITFQLDCNSNPLDAVPYRLEISVGCPLLQKLGSFCRSYLVSRCHRHTNFLFSLSKNPPSIWLYAINVSIPTCQYNRRPNATYCSFHTDGIHSGHKVKLTKGPSSYKRIYKILIYDTFSDINPLNLKLNPIR
jgi:hypothetical protein